MTRRFPVAALLAFGLVFSTLSVPADHEDGSTVPLGPGNNTLWLHGNVAHDPVLWLNTLGVDADDIGRVGMGPDATASLITNTVTDTYEFDVPIHPDAPTGTLVFDTATMVELHVFVRASSVSAGAGVNVPFSSPLIDVTLDASLSAGSVVIGSGTDTDTLELADPLGVHDFEQIELVIAFNPAVASVSPSDGAIILHLAFSYSRLGGDVPATPIDPIHQSIRTGGPAETNVNVPPSPSRLVLPILSAGGAAASAPSLVLSAESDSASAAAGDSAAYSLTVLNNGSSEALYNLSAAGLPEGINASFDVPNGSIAAGGTSVVEVTLEVGPDVMPGDYPFEVRSESESGVDASLNLSLTVTEASGEDGSEGESGDEGEPASEDEANGTAAEDAEGDASQGLPGLTGFALWAAVGTALALIGRRFRA